MTAHGEGVPLSPVASASECTSSSRTTTDATAQDGEASPPPGSHAPPYTDQHTHTCCPPAPVYVLAPDGSQLYLLDGSKPPGHEDPPPYAPTLGRPRAATFAGRTYASRAGYAIAPQRVYGVTGSTELSGPIEAEQHPREGFWTGVRAVLCGEDSDGGRIALRDDTEGRIALTDDGEEEDVAAAPRSAWRRYWAPLARKEYWYPIIHLICANFPFALLVWPILLTGTLTGTVLLITLPIGAVFWWLTLFVARWAAREEIEMQQRYHAVGGDHHLRPIFYRLRAVRAPSPLFPTDVELVWDKRFLRNSWAMLCDHYSYAALVYFLLIKPVTIFVPTILLVVFFPVCLALTPLLPIYLRAARRYGLYQANLAMSNL